jgi:hypothetical protein
VYTPIPFFFYGHILDGFTGPFDDLSNLAAAFSLRRLLSSYTGPLIRVRESGGNTEADIGYTADGSLDTAALLAHCGPNSGYVAKVYNQGSAGGDLTQATALEQHQIVNSGSVNVDAGGRPRLVCAASGTVLADWSATITGGTGWSTLAVIETSADQTVLLGGDEAAEFTGTCDGGSSSTTLYQFCGTPTFYANGSPQSPTTRDDMYGIYATGAKVLVEIRSLNLTSWSAIVPFGYEGGGYGFSGYFYEFVMFSATGAEAAAATAMNNYWEIY